jgi:thioester reductase-like protein
MAVLVRPARNESARQRVESILARWEKADGTVLPRPLVIEGDLLQEDLGLDACAQRWIARYCHSVVHNAASLTFYGSDRNGEPWRTNVQGTRRVLELCRTAGIGHLHYVSTAYVCGLRTGPVSEDEVDVGQSMGNDYEASKLQAEQLVRAADYLQTRTIYRPSIIVGDSRTGYTSTFHGMYVPLRLAHTLVSKLALGSVNGEMVLTALGLSGDERKNFVPVDWVSAVITEIVGCREHHGKTYHMVTRHPTPVVRLAQLCQQAVEAYSTLADPSAQLQGAGEWFAENFFDQMRMYRSYWRDDPQFDDANTVTAAPHLPCAVLDDAVMMRMARFAIQTNFSTRRARPIRPEFDVHQHLSTLLEAERAAPPKRNGDRCLGLQVNGPGGGQWKLILHDRHLVAAEPGLGPECSAVFRLDSPTFQHLAMRHLTVGRAIAKGEVVVEGNGLTRPELEAVLQAAATVDTSGCLIGASH